MIVSQLRPGMVFNSDNVALVDFIIGISTIGPSTETMILRVFENRVEICKFKYPRTTDLYVNKNWTRVA